eukprot:TRINITY_DN27670_c0_g1_i1.p1 TRINITY_DN27670_c0_g1~~TRINITY_DN27670_c0_g1_i1.p1  ORF type:complete len:829 (+),score=139.19 TRINITY_DN27670_c0_g1_i1:40-2526(+)
MWAPGQQPGAEAESHGASSLSGGDLADFLQVRSVGRGTFGEALLVVHKPSGRECVLKRVRVEAASRDGDGVAADTAMHEAEMLQRLRHPHIVEFLGAFADPRELSGDTICLLMAHCEGGDLQQRLQKVRQERRHLRETTVSRWFTQMADAIGYMHSHRVLHRDLKPSNIFLTAGLGSSAKPGMDEESVAIGDFGVSRPLSHARELVTTMVGTPCYLSPEVCKGKPYSYKSDIWSMGCIVFEMMALKPPFGAAPNLEALVSRIVSADYAVPDSVSVEYPEALRLVRAMLRLDADKRPSAQALVSQLQSRSELADHALGTPGAGPPPRRKLSVTGSPQPPSGKARGAVVATAAALSPRPGCRPSRTSGGGSELRSSPRITSPEAAASPPRRDDTARGGALRRGASRGSLAVGSGGKAGPPLADSSGRIGTAPAVRRMFSSGERPISSDRVAVVVSQSGSGAEAEEKPAALMRCRSEQRCAPHDEGSPLLKQRCSVQGPVTVRPKAAPRAVDEQRRLSPRSAATAPAASRGQMSPRTPAADRIARPSPDSAADGASKTPRRHGSHSSIPSLTPPGTAPRHNPRSVDSRQRNPGGVSAAMCGGTSAAKVLEHGYWNTRPAADTTTGGKEQTAPMSARRGGGPGAVMRSTRQGTTNPRQKPSCVTTAAADSRLYGMPSAATLGNNGMASMGSETTCADQSSFFSERSSNSATSAIHVSSSGPPPSATLTPPAGVGLLLQSSTTPPASGDKALAGAFDPTVQRLESIRCCLVARMGADKFEALYRSMSAADRPMAQDMEAAEHALSANVAAMSSSDEDLVAKLVSVERQYFCTA